MSLQDKLKHTIRDVADYPKQGIVFKDITPVLADPVLLREIVSYLKEDLKPLQLDAIAGVEARGFILGSILAHEIGCSFIPVRKAGKLPYKKVRQEYSLEYGTAAVEMHEDAISPGARVLIHDDLLATGGTATAAGEIVKSLGGIIAGFSFLINLSFLPGEQNLIDRFGVKPRYLIEY